MGRISTVLVLAFAAACAALGAEGRIAYDAQADTILVTGFTEGSPATLAALRKADAAGGWGVVAYDRASHTTAVHAHVTVGRTDGSSSFLRVGAPDRPGETLRMRGNLSLAPGKEESWKVYVGHNTLMLGVEDDAGLAAKLLFDCEESGQFGLEIGVGACLRAYNAIIAAAQLDGAHRASWKGTGDYSRVIGCTVAGFTRLYGFGTGYGADLRVRDTVFSDMDQGVVNGTQYFEDCTFRRMGTAIRDGGGLSGMLVRCRFEANDVHWQLQYSRTGLRAVDCLFSPADEKRYVCTGHADPKTGAEHRPVFLAERHLVFEVTDAQGDAIEGARVTLTPATPAHAYAVAQGTAVTGADGRTPLPETKRALFVWDYLVQATETPEPERIDYTYVAEVTAPGYAQRRIRELDADQDQQAVSVELVREK